MTDPLELLDCDRASEAGAAFGQIATKLPTGDLVLASARFVEHGVRATVLLMPGIFRADLTPSADTIGMHLRELSRHPARWRTAADAWDAARRMGDDTSHTPLDIEGEFDFPERQMATHLRLLVMGDIEAGGAYITARAVVGEVARP